MSIEQECTTKDEAGTVSTYYENVYSILIHEVTLRELLILESFYVTKTPKEIFKLVKMQPNPQFFFKAFMEFDFANFCCMLGFNSLSIENLLSDKNDKYF